MRRFGLIAVILLAGLFFASALSSAAAPLAVVNANVFAPPGNEPGAIVIVAFGSSEGMDFRMLSWNRVADDGTRQAILTIKNTDDEITLHPNLDDRCWVPRLPGRGGLDHSTVNCRADMVTKINVEGGAQNDLVCVIEATDSSMKITLDVHTIGGDDAITGGAGNDELNGGKGRDLIRGRDGDDDLYGFEFPADDDREPIGIDRDHLWGEAGTDHLWGGPDSDQVVGGTDFDVLCGADPEGAVSRAGQLHGSGCIDWANRDGENKMFSSEAKEFDLDTGIATPFAPDEDGVYCGGRLHHTTQYDVGLDTMVNCPNSVAPKPNPLQDPTPYRTPNHAATALRTRACPKVQ